MDVVGSDDHDVVQLLIRRQRSVNRNHLVIRTVTLEGVRPVRGFFEGDFRIREQRRSGHATGAVKVNGLLVGLNNERAFSATNQTDIKGSLGHTWILLLLVVKRWSQIDAPNQANVRAE